jgi:hypothetical protein
MRRFPWLALTPSLNDNARNVVKLLQNLAEEVFSRNLNLLLSEVWLAPPPPRTSLTRLAVLEHLYFSPHFAGIVAICKLNDHFGR